MIRIIFFAWLCLSSLAFGKILSEEEYGKYLDNNFKQEVENIKNNTFADYEGTPEQAVKKKHDELKAKYAELNPSQKAELLYDKKLITRDDLLQTYKDNDTPYKIRNNENIESYSDEKYKGGNYDEIRKEKELAFEPITKEQWRNDRDDYVKGKMDEYVKANPTTDERILDRQEKHYNDLYENLYPHTKDPVRLAEQQNQKGNISLDELASVYEKYGIPHKFVETENGKKLVSIDGTDYRGSGMSYDEAKAMSDKKNSNSPLTNTDNKNSGNIETNNANTAVGTPSGNNNIKDGGKAENAGTIANGVGTAGVGESGGNNGSNNGGSSGTQLIATAFTFGASALVFATLPFLFILLRGLYKANSGNNAHSGSVISVFSIAFIVHFVSCISFMVAIKMLDVLNNISNPNMLQNKVFGIFWARGESEVYNLAGASGSYEDKGAYLQLHLIQIATDWLFIAMYWAVFFCACGYALVQYKRDINNGNVVQLFVWMIVANVVGIFIFYLWAKIATLALFIPDGDVVNKIIEIYTNLVSNIQQATNN